MKNLIVNTEYMISLIKECEFWLNASSTEDSEDQDYIDYAIEAAERYMIAKERFVILQKEQEAHDIWIKNVKSVLSVN